MFILYRDLEEDEYTVQVEEIESVKWMDFQEGLTGVETNRFKHCISVEELQMVGKNANEYLL